MSVIEQREAIRAALKAGVRDLAESTTHGGRFTEEELRRWGAQAPCAITAVVGFGELNMEGGQKVATVLWATFIVAADTLTLPRDVAAIALVESALDVIHPAQRWDIETASMPENIEAQNLYGSKLDAMGIALWAITWKQKVDINVVDLSNLADFLRVRGSFKTSENEDTPRAEIAVDLPATGDE